MRPPDSAGAARPTAGAAARAHWEVLAAVAILLGVLFVIDTASIRQPVLLLSFGPLVFLLHAALFRLTLEAVAAWMAGFAGLALTAGDARYAGLAYPAVALGIALLIRSVRGHLRVRR